jgi:hypothetical protein
MKVNYIPVGSNQVEDLSWNPHDIATSLLEDWLPTMPLTLGTTFFGWPNHIIYELVGTHQGYLSIHRSLSTTDRQWKGVISWMLGIAGARRVLRQEGYRWIAPASAFYPRSNGQPNLEWPNQFPRTAMIIDRLPGSKSKFRPDYLALRRVNSRYELAAGEAKGNKMSITRAIHKECPEDWYNQVRNIRLTLRGNAVFIGRHIVVATRVNPSSSTKPKSRMLVLRAWNSANDGREPDPFVVVAIVIANLFGFLHNVGLPETANALARKLVEWSSERSEPPKFDELDSEKVFPIRLRLKTSIQENTVIQLNSSFKSLIHKLLSSENINEASSRVSEFDTYFASDDIATRNMESKDGAISLLPYGVSVYTSSSFE